MAGMGTRDIKRKIKSVNSTMQITKAMELVSTAKLKKAKDRFERNKPYFLTVLGTVQNILKNNQGIRHEYLEERTVRKTLYIILSADRGLCGGFNINALQTAVRDMKNREQSVLITVGKKATDFFKKNEFNCIENYVYISEKPTYLNAQRITKTALKLYANEEVDEIKLVYTKMISTMTQEAAVLRLLPVEVEESDLGTEVEEDDEFGTEATSYEPSPEAVLSYLIPLYVESAIYGALVESSSAEQAARRMAMENATDNAEEMIESLTLTFNQARQAAITQEISEIVGGANALE